MNRHIIDIATGSRELIALFLHPFVLVLLAILSLLALLAGIVSSLIFSGLLALTWLQNRLYKEGVRKLNGD